MQIKSTTRYHYTSIRMPKIKKGKKTAPPKKVPISFESGGEMVQTFVRTRGL